MSPYYYLPLSERLDSIRLLHLLPDADELAPVRGELVEYRLQTSRKPSHPYEALSYSWSGGVNHGQSILIGNELLHITPNLHAALLQLRDGGLPRLLWIDAICINQADDTEKAQQIQYMATIYGKASQVVIWLGPSADDSDRAFEAIRAAGKESTSMSSKKESYNDLYARHNVGKKPASNPKDDRIQDAVALLFQRRWFRRVWVLQEVAAARRILIACGNAEIDSHAFCAGLEEFKSANEADSGLRRQVHSLIYLIRQATYRSKLVSSQPGRASLDICSLGELIDMYHDYGATIMHDKIYAMLGMSTDELSESGLLPDYQTPWGKLLQRLVRFLLGRSVRARVWSNEDSIEITGKGCAIGSIERIEDKNGKQKVSVKFNRTYGQIVDGYHWWHLSLKSTKNHVQVGDVVCQLRGAPKPMIIRPHDDHWTVVIIMLVPSKRVRIKSFPRDFRLLWDWSPQSDNTMPQKQSFVDHGDRPTRLWDLGLILKDAGEDKQAEEKVLEAIKALLDTLTEAEETFIPNEVLDETVVKFGPAIVGMLLKHMWNRIDLPKLWPNIAEKQDEEVITYLLKSHPNAVEILTQEYGLWCAVQNTNPKVLELLLTQPNKAEVHITEAITAKAAGHWLCGVEMLSILLQERNDEVKITPGVIRHIPYYKFQPGGRKVLRLLLESKAQDADLTEEIIVQIVSRFDQELVQWLFDQHGDRITITEKVLLAAAENWEHSAEIMPFLLDQDVSHISLTEALVEKASSRADPDGYHSTMAVLLDRRAKSSEMNETMVAAIVGKCDIRTVQSLFDLKEDGIEITDTIALAAVRNELDAKVFEFVMDRGRDRVPVTQAMLVGATRSSNPDMVSAVLQRGMDSINITEEVLQAAVSMFGAPVMKAILEFDHSIHISEAVARKAAENCDAILSVLLELKRDAITITTCVLEAAVGNDHITSEVFAALFAYNVRVTETVLVAAAAREKDASRLILLLEHREEEVRVTEAVIHAALSNWDTGEEVMSILLDRKRDDVLAVAQTTTDDDLREKLSYWVPKKSHYAFECFTWRPSAQELRDMERYEGRDE